MLYTEIRFILIILQYQHGNLLKTRYFCTKQLQVIQQEIPIKPCSETKP